MQHLRTAAIWQGQEVVEVHGVGSDDGRGGVHKGVHDGVPHGGHPRDPSRRRLQAGMNQTPGRWDLWVLGHRAIPGGPRRSSWPAV